MTCKNSGSTPVRPSSSTRYTRIPTTDLIAPRLVEFATACGGTLARAHARTGDPVAIDGYIGKGAKFTAAIGQFARRYAEQNQRDHAQLVRAIASGAVESQPD